LSLPKEARSDQKLIEEILKLLHKNTRETDIKGWTDHDVIGLILPDTNEKGVKRCVEKITDGNADIKFSVITGTHPDHLFQKLLAEEQGYPDFFPVDLDEAPEFRSLQISLKRVMDIVGSIVGLMLFSPLMLFTAIAIKITSAGPIIFKQCRFGKKGIHFPLYKFRSMYINGDDQIHREYVTNLIRGELEKINQGDKETPLYKMKSDPRVTPVGKIIRGTSVDELPQFFNVLRGEMSLVGPRPPIPYEVEKYEPWHLRRILEVKPGITGIWQVNGRSTTSFDDMVRLDLKYVQNWSLWLDVKILLKTVKAVIRPKGAH
jgi:exopolysaccharide biosynthesis polyprenyl glycosylphosphotransferase